MLSGNIAKINSQSERLDGFTDASMSDDAELKSFVELRGEYDINGNSMQFGVAVDEYYDTVEDISVSDGIDIAEDEIKKRMWTSFWISDDDFIVVRNSNGTFAFDIIERAINGEVERGEFDLHDIINQYPGQWMGSFDDRPDNVNSGTLFGEDIEQDPDIGDVYETSDKNQIGVRIPYGGKDYTVRVGESFVQLYGINDRQEWLEFVESRMLGFIQ